MLAARAGLEHDSLPLFWEGWWKLPHGALAIHLYAASLLVWPKLSTPFLVNALLTSLTCLALILSGRVMNRAIAGVIAAGIYAFHPTFAGFYSQTIWQATPLMAVTTTALYLTVAYLNSRRPVECLYMAAILVALLPQFHLLGLLFFPAFVLIIRGVPRDVYARCAMVLLIGLIPHGAFLIKSGVALIAVCAFGASIVAVIVPRGLDRFLHKGAIGVIPLVIVCGALLYDFDGFATTIGGLFRVTDTLTSYNLRSSENAFLSFLQKGVPEFERLFLLLGFLCGTYSFQRFTIGEQAVFLWIFTPVALFAALVVFVEPRPYSGNFYWTLFFPAPFLLIGLTIVRLVGRLSPFVGSALVIASAVSLTIFYRDVSQNGRPTFNRILLGEYLAIADFISTHNPCMVSALTSARQDHWHMSLIVKLALGDSGEHRARVICSGNYSLYIAGTLGAWSHEDILSAERAGTVSLFTSKGRLRVYQNKTTVGGLLVYPPRQERLRVIARMHGFPTVRARW